MEKRGLRRRRYPVTLITVSVAISSCIRAVSATAVVDFSKLLTCDFKEADGTFLESTNWGARDAVTSRYLWNDVESSDTLGKRAWNSDSLFAGDKETFDSSTTRLINIPTGRTDGFVIYATAGRLTDYMAGSTLFQQVEGVSSQSAWKTKSGCEDRFLYCLPGQCPLLATLKWWAPTDETVEEIKIVGLKLRDFDATLSRKVDSVARAPPASPPPPPVPDAPAAPAAPEAPTQQDTDNTPNAEEEVKEEEKTPILPTVDLSIVKPALRPKVEAVLDLTNVIVAKDEEMEEAQAAITESRDAMREARNTIRQAQAEKRTKQRELSRAQAACARVANRKQDDEAKDICDAAAASAAALGGSRVSFIETMDERTALTGALATIVLLAGLLARREAAFRRALRQTTPTMEIDERTRLI